MRFGVVSGVFALAGFGGMVWWAADQLASPARRGVQALALPYFEKGSMAGFRVERYVARDGTPCLVCIPVATEVLSKRAGLIRAQLEERGHDLPSPGSIIGNLVILHGRGGTKEDYLPVAERFCAVGFCCVIPDLPGHGGHPKDYSTYGVKEAAGVLDCLNEVVEKHGLVDQPGFVFGQSMGGSVAMYVMAEAGASVRAGVVLSSFERLDAVVMKQAEGLFGKTGAGLLMPLVSKVYEGRVGVALEDIRPLDLAKRQTVPTLVMHGGEDGFVPMARGRKLYEALPPDLAKKWVEVPGANHNNVLITDFPVYATVAEWFLEHAGNWGEPGVR